MNKTVVLGIDGANWKFIEPWIDSNHLQNLKKLKEKGTHSTSKAWLPPTSCPNWKCYSTGKNPGKLGVYWWERIDTENKEIEISNSLSFKSAELWDYLDSKVGVLNMPTTYPPKEINGFLVSGGPTSDENNYTYPKDLEEKLEDQYNYKVRPKERLSSKNADQSTIENILNLIEKRFEVALDFLDEVEFLHLTIFYINVLQHFFGRDEPTKKGWKIIDDKLGKLMERDTNIFLMSDHGTHPVNTVFNINAWLEDEGFQKVSRETSSLLRAGLTISNVRGLVDKLGMKNVVKRLAPDFFKSALPDSEKGVKRKKKIEALDWENTNAVASGQGVLYICKKKSEENREKVKEMLENLESPFTEKNIAKEVHDGEKYYHGDYVDIGPDIVFEQEKGVHTGDPVGGTQPFEQNEKWECENVPEGIFLAYGEDIKTGRMEENKITDIAPTILHYLDTPIPEDMDGKVLPIFREGSESNNREVKYQESLNKKQEKKEKEKERIKKKVKDLSR